MKKLTLLLLAVCIIYFNIPVSANPLSSTTIVETFDDGSYIESTIETETGSGLNVLSTSSTKSGHKTTAYKSSSGKVLWSITVTGTFSYNGSSATCTSVTKSTSCPDKNWKIASSSARKSGASASATATAKQYHDGTYLRSLTKTVTLTCSKTGKLS